MNTILFSRATFADGKFLQKPSSRWQTHCSEKINHRAITIVVDSNVPRHHTGFYRKRLKGKFTDMLQDEPMVQEMSLSTRAAVLGTN